MPRFLALLLLAVAATPAFALEEKKEPSQEDKLFHAYPDGGVPVGDFRLQERSGKFVGTRDLRGKICVVQFFYFYCPLCARNNPTMKALQDHYRGKADVRLVGISLKPASLEMLEEFAEGFEADPEQWLLLTGSQERVADIVTECFLCPSVLRKNADLGDEIIHKTDLVLIDANGMMVGYVDGKKQGAAEALIEQIDLLRTRRRLEERIPVTGADLPWFNAMLNSSCTVLLLLGWIAIRLRFETLHKILMLLALAVSMVFLASYLFYHFAVMGAEPTRFRGEGAVRYLYFAILLSHTLLAIAVAPMALYVAVQGLRNSLAAHVKIARWTLPIWLYVSVTGVVVYWMLYRMDW
jgi:uncharacterized membrane protein YozB (DUF420 family)/cytochrome oxidase Cu insertion factor (SCO1/SenC/PrrC family)